MLLLRGPRKVCAVEVESTDDAERLLANENKPERKKGTGDQESLEDDRGANTAASKHMEV